ncbi:PREDICTED: von Willebrand factor C domain-containing protein 2-like isoform X1 [Hipposideros armiger]|uniref:von Willebrand factor C domain-containing protein 2-like isoform X1 n=1 Tax=Hipposideros armiger TaxID=186990 RepID=A0A8B7QMI3_HIPAR|nr:PREDICTED: von Willebrand factor C domain-containing protein 2-like isoform X1 [Hipposideros armiger]
MALHIHEACILLLVIPGLVTPAAISHEDYPADEGDQMSSNDNLIFDDYRGKGCVDDSGFVYKLGERFFPGHSNCPCVCALDGPVCDQPECPKIHPKCTKVEHNGCCPECKEVKNFCEYHGKNYKILEEFKLQNPSAALIPFSGRYWWLESRARPQKSFTEGTYIGPNWTLRFTPCISEMCGPNCFAGTTIIPAGIEVKVDECNICHCHNGDWWKPAQCSKRECQGKQTV